MRNESWQMKLEHEVKLDRNEMTMFGWIRGCVVLI